MKNIVVKNLQNQITHGPIEKEDGEVDNYVLEMKSTKQWGKLAFTEILEDGSTIDHPDQFTVEITDTTSEAEQQQRATTLTYNLGSFGSRFSTIYTNVINAPVTPAVATHFSVHRIGNY